MFYMCILLLPLITKIDEINAQTGGTLPDGRTYVCVPPGFCNNNGSPPSSPGIDPRIVTPGQVCPSGTIACYTQGTSSSCGLRFVTYNNGQDGPVTVPGAYPWQAWLRNVTNDFAGSGVLLDNYHVLTAAHKVALNVNSPNSLQVQMGVFNPTQRSTAQNLTVSRIILHPQYDATYLKNDIAILRLANPVALSQPFVNTACLPPTGSNSLTFVGCVVAGWGQTNFENPSTAPTVPMKQVFVNVTTYATCRTSFLNGPLPTVDSYLDSNGEICAGGVAQRDACTQDGGSPLICPDSTGRGYIAGLVIWGKNCGQPGVYGVYVSVPAYLTWISNTITCLNNNNAAC